MTTENKSIFHYSDIKALETALSTKKVNVNDRNVFGQTRLMIETNENIAELLIKHGADLNAKCSCGNNIYFYNESIPVLKLVSTRLTFDEMLSNNKKGENALFRKENIEFDKFIELFKEKAKVENRFKEDILKKFTHKDVLQKNALFTKKNIENIKLLLELGLDINSTDRFNNTFIYNTKQNNFINNKEDIQYLLSKGLRPLITNKSGENLLTITKNMDVFNYTVNRNKSDIYMLDGLELLKTIQKINFDKDNGVAKKSSLFNTINLNKTNLVMLNLEKIEEEKVFDKNLIENIKLNMEHTAMKHKENKRLSFFD